ncbi:MAG: hypothetical protein ABW184_06790 [Sphingobium sp.]
MSNEQTDKVQTTIDHVLELAAEVEASGDSHTAEDHVAILRASLHEWVDSVAAVANVPAFGRVTLIHRDGHRSTIQSSELSYTLSLPVGPRTD